MSATKKSVISVFILAAMGVITLLLLVRFPVAPEKINCTATVKWIDYPDKKIFTGTIVFDLTQGKEGTMNITGLLKDGSNNQTYQVRRELRMISEMAADSKIAINISKVHAHLSDNVPNQLFNQYLIDTTARTLLLGFKKLHNAWLISTPYTAAIMCVNPN